MCIEKNVKLLPSLLLMLIMALLLTPLSINAQDSAKVVQFSGYVVTPDSLVGIPFVTIRVEGKTEALIPTQMDTFRLLLLRVIQ